MFNINGRYYSYTPKVPLWLGANKAKDITAKIAIFILKRMSCCRPTFFKNLGIPRRFQLRHV